MTTTQRFTMYLNSAGDPVQRALGQMTPDEVLAAIEWNDNEAERHAAMADASLAAIQPLITSGDITVEQAMATREMQNAAIEAMERSARLLEMVLDNLSQWHPNPSQRLRDAIRSHWPR